MADAALSFDRDGVIVFDADPRVEAWAAAAHRIGCEVAADPDMRARWLRHGGTWFVGVDALPNDKDGAIDAVPLQGPWEGLITPPAAWHPAQLSVVFPGYPQKDPDESVANHQFRVRRAAAHVDGLHLEDGRRILREPHAFVLGLPLSDSSACPLRVWPGSHHRFAAAFRAALLNGAVLGSDLTETYKETRADCFEQIEPIDLRLRPGQSVLLHRLTLHGVAPWHPKDEAPPEGRMVAYFRPEFPNADQWL
ncbi:MAG: hypothetical protein AAGL89_06435 [Pseudomonadota bacterium]